MKIKVLIRDVKKMDEIHEWGAREREKIGVGVSREVDG